MTNSKLPSKWIKVTIGEILKSQSDGKLIHQGWSPRCHTKSAPEGEWGVLKTTAIQDGYYLEYANKHLPYDKKPKPRIEVKNGDLLMTNAGPRLRCGVTTLVKKTRSKLMLSGKMYRMRFNESYIYPKYIEACFQSNAVKKEIDSRKTGISESGLNLTQKRFLSVPLILCPHNEQIRIANKLDSLLGKLEATQKRLDKIPTLLKRFRQSVLAAAVSGELTAEWRELNNSIKWEEKTLLDVVLNKPRNGKSPRGVDYETPYKNLTLSAITLGYFVENKFKYINLDSISDDSYLWINNGDILIQRANSLEYVGVSAIYKGESKKYVYPDLIMKCTPNDLILGDYLHYSLLSKKTRKYFRDNATGTAGNMPKINQKTVSSTPINLPTISEQKQIVKKVESLFKLADKVEQQYQVAKQRTDKLTQSILAKAFRGELVPQDPNDEPASELLKRIKELKI